MIGICQGQTELSSPSSRRRVVSSRFLTGRALYASYRERILYLQQFVFLAPSFCVSVRSTAKRDQSFICAYPAFREGLSTIAIGPPHCGQVQSGRGIFPAGVLCADRWQYDGIRGNTAFWYRAGGASALASSLPRQPMGTRLRSVDDTNGVTGNYSAAI
jgi:hypothetical protein